MVHIKDGCAERMGIYDLKAECLAPLRNVCNHEYEGELAALFKTLQAACESRRWNLESCMETEAGMAQWISELDAALAAFQNDTRPEDTLRVYVDKQIAASKKKAVEMQQSCCIYWQRRSRRLCPRTRTSRRCWAK